MNMFSSTAGRWTEVGINSHQDSERRFFCVYFEHTQYMQMDF